MTITNSVKLKLIEILTTNFILLKLMYAGSSVFKNLVFTVSFYRSDLSELPILALCLKEAMRLYPPVPFIQRELTEETIIDGHMIPKGTLVTVSIVHLHVNPTVWEDRDEFRFGSKHKQLSYKSFSMNSF